MSKLDFVQFAKFVRIVQLTSKRKKWTRRENMKYTRRPATIGIFSALQFLQKCLLQGWKRVSLIIALCRNFFNFAKFENLWFCCKKLNFGGKRHFWKNISFLRTPKQICHHYRFWKTIMFLSEKKTNFVRIWKILLFSVAFYGKFAFIWW